MAEPLEQEILTITDFENATDFELKHSPNVVASEQADSLVLNVTIGLNGLTHPQTEEHLIEWIRVYIGDEIVGEANFGPDDTPEASFEVVKTDAAICVRAFCNLHGIWETRV